MAAEYEMRVSDAEREAAAAELREHFASGRLDQEELDQRLSSVFAARTRGDLNSLFNDLPSSGPGWAGAPAGGRPFTAGVPGGGPWTGRGSSDGADRTGWPGRGNAGPGPVGRGIGRFVFASVLVPLLLIVGVLGIFGLGTGRPLGVVLVFAAFALLRRLVFMIFGRRMGRGRGRGGRGRGRRC